MGWTLKSYYSKLSSHYNGNWGWFENELKEIESWVNRVEKTMNKRKE